MRNVGTAFQGVKIRKGAFELALTPDRRFQTKRHADLRQTEWKGQAIPEKVIAHHQADKSDRTYGTNGPYGTDERQFSFSDVFCPGGDRYTQITLRTVISDVLFGDRSLRFVGFSTRSTTSHRRHSVCHRKSRKLLSATVTCSRSL